MLDIEHNIFIQQLGNDACSFLRAAFNKLVFSRLRCWKSEGNIKNLIVWLWFIENNYEWWLFLIFIFRPSGLYINKIQRDAAVCRCLFTAKLLYMFRVSIVPIIRSTSNCNCSYWYRS